MSTPLLPDSFVESDSSLVTLRAAQAQGMQTTFIRPRLSQRDSACPVRYTVGDSCSIRAVLRAADGPNPTDRAQLRSKGHLISNGQGVAAADATHRSQPSRFAASTRTS